MHLFAWLKQTSMSNFVFFEMNFSVSWKKWICQNIFYWSSKNEKCFINCRTLCSSNLISLIIYTSWRVRHNEKRIIINVLTMSNFVDDRMQSLRSRSKRKLQSIVQCASLRSRSRSMKKLNQRSLNRQYEISISIVLQILERQIFLERLISIRLKRNLWKRKNVLIATNQIISVEIAQNRENSEWLRWTWKN
jgi:hypothetical protein